MSVASSHKFIVNDLKGIEDQYENDSECEEIPIDMLEKPNAYNMWEWFSETEDDEDTEDEDCIISDDEKERIPKKQVISSPLSTESQSQESYDLNLKKRVETTRKGNDTSESSFEHSSDCSESDRQFTKRNISSRNQLPASPRKTRGFLLAAKQPTPDLHLSISPRRIKECTVAKKRKSTAPELLSSNDTDDTSNLNYFGKKNEGRTITARRKKKRRKNMCM